MTLSIDLKQLLASDVQNWSLAIFLVQCFHQVYVTYYRPPTAAAE